MSFEIMKGRARDFMARDRAEKSIRQKFGSGSYVYVRTYIQDGYFYLELLVLVGGDVDLDYVNDFLLNSFPDGRGGFGV